MTETVSVRPAIKEEIDWINSRYDEVGFVHSDFSNEQIVIAEVAGVKAGVGRLVQVTLDEAELGGMLVFENFRGHGIAGKLVELLLQQSIPYKRVFCLPFSHLTGFYKKFGFYELEPNTIDAPEKVNEKHKWCNQNYEHRTLLLLLTNNDE